MAADMCREGVGEGQGHIQTRVLGKERKERVRVDPEVKAFEGTSRRRSCRKRTGSIPATRSRGGGS